MCTKEREILVSLISSVLIFVIYSLYVYQKYISINPEIIHNLEFWGKAFLILIPVTIVANIMIHIIFHIVHRIVTKEEIQEITDERDKMIELRGIKIAHWIITLGFLTAMAAIAFGQPVYVMFLILILSGFGGSIISEICKIYFYRKGF